jgi:hypothetical protein
MAGNKNSGRATKGQELALVEWYKSVLPEVFSIVSTKLKSNKEADKLWAMEWLKTGIVKMIPQKIGGDPDNRTPIPILGMTNVPNNNSHQENTKPGQENTGSTGGNISQQDHINPPIPDKQSTDGQQANPDLGSIGVLSALEAGSDEGLPEYHAGA